MIIVFSKKDFKNIFLIFSIFFLNIGMAQQEVPLRPFEDSYDGIPDFNIKLGKIKSHKIYRKVNSNEERLYIERNYNRNGFLISQDYYDLMSKKIMYSAHYEYTKNDSLFSCVEKMSRDYYHFDAYSMKISNDGQPLNLFTDNPMADTIPMDKDGNTVVKTIYQSGLYGGYIAKKYFYDGSFYKEQECNFLDYGFTRPYGIFINKNKTIDLDFDRRFFITDTVYKSADSIIFYIKAPENEKTYGMSYFKVLKVKRNNEFIVSEIDRLINLINLHELRIRFSYLNMGNSSNCINSITYSKNYIGSHELLLEHKIEFFDPFETPLLERIELKDFYYNQYFSMIGGGLNYTSFKNGSLYKEVHYSLIDDVEKLRSIKYQSCNLVDEKVIYPSAYQYIDYGLKVHYSERAETKEINRYIYFND